MSESMRKILYYENILEFKESSNSALLRSEVKNWQLCRTCLVDPTIKDFIEIGKMFVVGMDGNFISLQNMLKEATGLEIPQNDRLPLNICSECFNKITTFYFFKLQTNRANNVLNNLLEKISETEVQDSPNDEGVILRNEVDTTVNDITLENSSEDCVKMIIERDESSNQECSITEVHDDNQIIEEGDPESFINEVNDQSKGSEDLLKIEAIVDEEFITEEEDQKNENNCTDVEEEYYLEDLEELDDMETSSANNENIIEMSIVEKEYVDTKENKSYEKNLTSKSATVKRRMSKNSTEEESFTNKRIYITNEEKKPKLLKSLLETLTCVRCQMDFKKQRDLVKHVQSEHSKRKVFKCRECGAMFAHTQSLSRHMQNHKPKLIQIICDTCGRIFKRADDLKRHIRCHTGERPYVCSICQKGFKQSNELKEHLLSHQNEKMFKCDICGHRLSSRNGLYIHKKAHIGIKSFVCQHCEKKFLTNGELKSHLKVHLKHLTIKE